MAKDNGPSPNKPSLANPPSQTTPMGTGEAGAPPKPPVEQVTVQDLLLVLQRQQAEINEMRAKQLPVAAQDPTIVAPSIDILAREALALGKRQKQLQALTEWHDKSTQQRSQEEMDRQYPDGPRRFRVGLLGAYTSRNDRDQPSGKRQPMPYPPLEINATDPLHAQAIYQKVCSITGLNGPEWVVEEIAKGPTSIVPAPNMTPPPELLQLQILKAG